MIWFFPASLMLLIAAVIGACSVRVFWRGKGRVAVAVILCAMAAPAAAGVYLSASSDARAKHAADKAASQIDLTGVVGVGLINAQWFEQATDGAPERQASPAGRATWVCMHVAGPVRGSRPPTAAATPHPAGRGERQRAKSGEKRLQANHKGFMSKLKFPLANRCALTPPPPRS